MTFFEENFSLTNKIALITGGNTGIGYQIALALAKAGADLYLFCHHDHDNSTTITQEIESLGRKVYFQFGELTDPKVIKNLIPNVLEQNHQLDILVNNAGTIARTPLLQGTDEEWEKVLALNLTAVYQLSREAAKVMIKTQHGKIINIASMLSYQGGIYVPSYTASKHGVVGLTKAFCNELASENIQVNAIAPGYINTANTLAIRQDANRSAEILARIPAKRWGQPNDIGLTAVFLASPASNYINGCVIPVDGGWLAR